MIWSNSPFQGKHALVGTVLANLLVFAWQRENKPDIGSKFSVCNQSLGTMMVSMFTHADSEHLLANMMGLILSGRRVFGNKSSCDYCDSRNASNNKIWTDPLSFMTLYLGSGIGAFLGVARVSAWHEQQWQTKLTNNREALLRIMPWLWDGRNNGVLRYLADTYTHVTNWYSVSNMFIYSIEPRIGASGAVYGIFGARIYSLVTNPAASFTSGAPPLVIPVEALMFVSEIAYVTTVLVHELAQCPLRLESLHYVSNPFVDKVDHVAHVAGFLSGVAISATMHFVRQLIHSATKAKTEKTEDSMTSALSAIKYANLCCETKIKTEETHDSMTRALAAIKLANLCSKKCGKFRTLP